MNTYEIRKKISRLKDFHYCRVPPEIFEMVFELTGEIDHLRLELNVAEYELEKHREAQMGRKG